MSSNVSERTCQFEYKNDYDYPMLNRRDLMSLSSISSRDFPIRKIKNQINTKREWSSNLYTLDIEKAYPNRFDQFQNKPDFINKIDDIEKARPSPLKQNIKYNFQNKDNNIISNTRDLLFNSKRCTNPLNPKYKLPSVKQINDDTLPQKFIKDPLYIGDIEGSKVKNKKLNTEKRECNYNIEKEYNNNNIKNNMNTNLNIQNNNNNYIYKKWKSNRSTNPLEPNYGVYGNVIEGAKPASYPIYNNNIFNYLSNDDILGTNNSYSHNKIYMINNHRNNISCSDIFGTQTGTLKKGITTNRITNPLHPQYQMPGESEIINQDNKNIYNNSNNSNNNSNIAKSQNNKSIEQYNNISDSKRFESIMKYGKYPYTNNKTYHDENEYNSIYHNNSLISIKNDYDNNKISHSCNNIFNKSNNNNTKSNDNKRYSYNNNIYKEISNNSDDIFKKIIKEQEDNTKKESHIYRPDHSYRYKHFKELQASKLNERKSRMYELKQSYECPKITRNKYAQSYLENFNEQTHSLNYSQNNYDSYLNMKYTKNPPFEKQLDYFIKDNDYECK